MSELIKFVESKNIKAKPPQFDVGDTVKVKVLIREGKKERVQAFEGVVLAKQGSGVNKSFTVRRVFQGIGVERTFVLHSPKVQDVKIIRSGKTRRAKLFFLRDRIGSKASRLQEDTAKTAKAFEAAAARAAEDKAAAKAAAKKVEEDRAEADKKAKKEEEAKAETKS